MSKSSFDREPMWKMSEPCDEPLTKRERFAMAAMQGMNANPKYEDETVTVIADLAIGQADELLKLLNE